MSVSESLERARECSRIADTLTGDDKKKLLEIAEAWLEVADEQARRATSSGTATNPR